MLQTKTIVQKIQQKKSLPFLSLTNLFPFYTLNVLSRKTVYASADFILPMRNTESLKIVMNQKSLTF